MSHTTMSGVTIDKWGPAAWNTLHAFAHTSPSEMTPQEQTDVGEFLLLFSKHLPCPICREHFESFLLERFARDGIPDRRHELVALLNDAHNDVNARSGKRVFTLEEHYKLYRRPEDVKLHNTTIFIIAILLICVTTAVSYANKKNPH